MKNKYKSEIAFDQDLKKFIESKLDLPRYALEIDLKTKIILDIVFFPKLPRKFYLHLSLTECDLVIYTRLLKEQTEMWSNLRRERFHKIIKFYRFGKNEIVIPMVIIETKNEGMSSHDLLLYSTKADKIKNIFPYVKYLLVCNYTTKQELTLARHGQYFDGIYVLHRKQDGVRQPTNDLNKLIKGIQENIEKSIEEETLKKTQIRTDIK